MKRWGQAKREVTALWPLISKELDEKSVCQVWDELHKAGQVTVCRSKFYLHVNRRLQPHTTSPAAGRDLAVRAVVPSPVIVPDRPVSFSDEGDLNRPFSHSNRPIEEELW